MSRPGTYYPDGFCHGGELPDDLDLDQMIYPEREPKPEDLAPIPFDMPYEERQAERERREEERLAQNEREDRQFAITEGNVTGRKTGPPRTP